MLIAAFSDVHGNLRALEAVLADIGRRRPDLVLNLGDCVSGPLWPRETAELLQSLSIPTVRGNHDRLVGAGEVEAMGSIDRFAHERVTDAQRAWLLGLPFDLALEGMRCFHANPRDDMGYFTDEAVYGVLRLADPKAIRKRLNGAAAPLLLCGHSHQPRVVAVAPGVTAVNPGSVGWQAYPDAGPPRHISEVGSPHARYAVIDTSGSIRAELVAVEYDWEDAARAAVANDRPDWAHALRTGRVR